MNKKNKKREHYVKELFETIIIDTNENDNRCMYNQNMKESVYARGFKKSLQTGDNIFGLIKDIQDYTDGMDKERAVEEAVYAAVDYVKNGNL